MSIKKIRFLFSGNFDIEGQPRHYEKDEIEEVQEADAARLVSDKCAEYVQKEVKHERKNSKQMD